MDTSLQETTFFPDQPFYQECIKDEPVVPPGILTMTDSTPDKQTLTQEEATRILPVSIYSTEFVDPSKFPIVFGKPLEQRVWIIVAKLSSTISRNTLKNIRKRMEGVMDYTKYYDPYSKVKTSSVRVYLDPNYMHIVLDTIMSRKMRMAILTCVCEINEIRPNIVILSKLDEMIVYKVPDAAKNAGTVLQSIVMGRYTDRQKYRVPTKMYNEFPTTRLLPAINITSSGIYLYKRDNV